MLGNGGSDASCIFNVHVRALGMVDQIVPRDAARENRVRGIREIQDR